MRVLAHSIKYQLLIFLRIKQAVFFSLAFPVFMFVVFGSIWGAEGPEYVAFLLSGIIGMTVASDSLFGIGPVIKEYYANGLIKYLRKLPFHILWHFSGLIISRIISLFFTTSVLCLVALLVFNYKVSGEELLRFSMGIITGMFLFSFLGLIVSFLNLKQGEDKGLINLIYFAVLFTSNAFYPVANFNKVVGAIGDALPLNPVLAVLRGEAMYWSLLLWLILPVLLFSYLFKRVQLDR